MRSKRMDKLNTEFKRYLSYYLSPLNNILFKTELKDDHFIDQLTKRITDFGFDGSAIMKILKDQRGTSLLTGSFLLNFLTNPTDWSANDIDIFTVDTQLHKKFESTMSEHAKDRYGERISSPTEYPEGLSGLIEDLYEWRSRYNPKHKFQIIVVNEDPDYVIDKFDLDIVKSYSDGTSITVPSKTLRSIRTGTCHLSSTFDSLYKLNRTLERREKYTDRGYNILLPQYIGIDDTLYMDYIRTEYPYIAKFYEPQHDTYLGNIIRLKDEHHHPSISYNPYES